MMSGMFRICMYDIRNRSDVMSSIAFSGDKIENKTDDLN